jgi:hypothetical protein
VPTEVEADAGIRAPVLAAGRSEESR